MTSPYIQENKKELVSKYGADVNIQNNKSPKK